MCCPLIFFTQGVWDFDGLLPVILTVKSSFSLIGQEAHLPSLPYLFWQFTVLLSKFDLPQEKKGLITIIINFVYKLVHELPSDLRIRALENWETIGISQDWVRKQHSDLSLLQKSISYNNNKKLVKFLFHLILLDFLNSILFIFSEIKVSSHQKYTSMLLSLDD